MGKISKKNAKGRLDKYYYLAKEKGYRARSSFKIIQINEKYGHFLEKSKVVIDLCAAPGSWCQVASSLCPINSLIIGVDIVPIKPLPNCITFQSDITTEDCRSKLRGHLKTWKADTVLHDGAPNVGLGWVQDAFTQSQLTLQALKLAVENLVAGGTFVTKIFRSRDYNNLMWVFQQLFDKVEATKPPASRNVSAEIFVVCRGFKAPKKLDPRLLDPKEVFEELGQETVNNEAKVFKPEVKKRHRTGYEEGDNLLYHEKSMMDFIREDDPINALGGLNKLVVPSKEEIKDEENKDEDVVHWRVLRKLKTCTPELLECLKDLKVLGRKDFKQILRFRKQARELLGLDEEEKEEVEEVELDEEEKIDREIQELKEKQRLKRRREKKHANEAKQKEIVRNQMNMLTDMNIGLEAANIGAETLFNLNTAKKTGILDKLSAGKKRMVLDDSEVMLNNDIHIDADLAAADDANSGDELDGLEAQLDDMYSKYKERRAERDAKFRARQARGDDDEEAWDGIQSEDEEDDRGLKDDDSDFSDSDDDEHIQRIVDANHRNNLSKNAKMFFAANDVFNGVDDDALLAQMTKGKGEAEATTTTTEKANGAANGTKATKAKADDSDDSDFEVVDGEDEYETGAQASDSDEEDVDDQYQKSSHQDKVDLATVEAMTLAHQVALGKMNKHDLINEGINKYSFRDQDNLPSWFVEEEKRHSKIIKPITKEAANAIKEKQKQLNARPIKKVLEAQGRKKMRALRRLEKLKKKSDLINEDSAMSERDKSDEISKLMRKFTKKQKTKPKLTVVKASGANRGLSGRPRGVKGKYKMVDGVSKNEARALRRIAKKKGKK